MVVFLSFLSGIALFFLFPYFPVGSSLLFGAGAGYALLKRKPFLLAVVAVAILYAMLRVPSAVDSHIWNRELRATGRIIPKIRAKSDEHRLKIFQVEEAFKEGGYAEVEELRGKEVGVETDLEESFDKRYELLLKTGRDRTRLNPCGADGDWIYASVIKARERRGGGYSVSDVFSLWRNGVNEYTLGRFKEDSAALIASVTTGETLFLGDDIKNSFSVTGLAHLLSISGAHFGLFSVMIFGIFNFLIRRLPYGLLQRLTLYLTPAQASAMLCMPFMIAYLGISGAKPPAVRSFVMISLFLVGLLIGRKGFWLNSLLFAAVSLAIWDPGVILSLSFQLSFLAVLFIGFAIERREEDIDTPKEGKTPLRVVKQSLILTLSATLGTFPLVAYYFHYFSLISPLANLIAGPLIGFVLVPLSVLSSFAYLLSGHYVFAPIVSLSADASVALVVFMSRIPHAALRIPSFPPVLCALFYILFIPYLIFGRKKMLLALPFVPFLLFLVVHAAGKKEMSVTFLDVGQGDSAVVALPGGTVVIDTGRTGRETADYLKCTGIGDIDAVAVTHIHPDHCGGLDYLKKRFRVKEIWDNGLIVYPFKDMRRRPLERGDIIESGNYCITALHPSKGFYTFSDSAYEEENNSSLVLRVTGRNSSFLFSGDVEEEAEEDMTNLGGWLRSDVLKVPHHGSRVSADDAFLSTVSPEVVVISAGRDNPFGHPAQEVLTKLAGKKIYRTDVDGAIKMTETGNGLEIKTYKEYAFRKADSVDAELHNLKRLFTVW